MTSFADWSVAPDVAWVDDQAVYVARVPDGVPLVLEDSAAAIWRAVAAGAEIEADEDVASDVSAFLDQLLAAGLVVRTR
ncbi:hypothetical protein [Nocardioides montaniterrae]